MKTAVENKMNFPWLALLLVFPAVLFHAVPEIQQLLQFDRAAVKQGQFYRLITAHWTHWTAEHFVWDTAVFLVLGAVCERISRCRFVLCAAFAALLISAAVWFLLPQLSTYRGLSGLDSALYSLALVLFFRHFRREKSRAGMRLTVALLLVFFCKVLYEMQTGQTVFVQDSAALMQPVPLAHLLGFAVGVLTAIPAAASAAGDHSRLGK